MATLAAPPRTTAPYERIFFTAMSLLIAATVALGFAHTYYLAGLVRAPLPNLLIHIHGAVFTLWIVVLVTQTLFVAAGRIDLHRSLGLAGFALAVLMVALGLLASLDQMRRGHAPFGLPPETFFVVPFTDIILFGIFVALAWRARRRPQSHKRLILLANLAILDAAVFRWPFAFVQNPHLGDLTSLAFLLPLIAWDLWTTRRIHRVTLWAGLALIIIHQVRMPLAFTPLWHAFAHAARGLAEFLH